MEQVHVKTRKGMDTTILGCNDFNPYQNQKAGMTVMAAKLIFLSFLSQFRAVLRGSSLAGLRTLHHKCGHGVLYALFTHRWRSMWTVKPNDCIMYCLQILKAICKFIADIATANL
ncbi:hypothetical protein Tco_0964498 [Tanacetum coccineum]